MFADIGMYQWTYRTECVLLELQMKIKRVPVYLNVFQLKETGGCGDAGNFHLLMSLLATKSF